MQKGQHLPKWEYDLVRQVIKEKLATAKPGKGFTLEMLEQETEYSYGILNTFMQQLEYAGEVYRSPSQSNGNLGVWRLCVSPNEQLKSRIKELEDSITKIKSIVNK